MVVIITFRNLQMRWHLFVVIPRILAEEGIAYLPNKPKTIMTPTNAPYQGVEVDETNACAVSIIRSGDALLDAVRLCLPHCYVGQ